MFEREENEEDRTALWKTMWFFKTIWWRITDAWYLFRSLYIKRYHLVDLRSERFGYRSGYCDPVEKLKLAMFKIFCDFIEQEDPLKNMGIETEEPWLGAYKEMDSIYRWLAVEREEAKARVLFLETHFMESDWPKYKFVKSKEFGEMFYTIEQTQAPGKKHEEHEGLSNEIDKKDKEALDRILKIREFLWT